MSILRAIAEHYAALPNMTVPPERFTEGHRAAHDHLPSITFQRTAETEDFHQHGSGVSTLSCAMTIWAETPGQADRIAAELRDAFHLMNHREIGSGADAVRVQLCTLTSVVDVTGYPEDGSADWAVACNLYFDFQFRPSMPSNP